MMHETLSLGASLYTVSHGYVQRLPSRTEGMNSNEPPVEANPSKLSIVTLQMYITLANLHCVIFFHWFREHNR